MNSTSEVIHERDPRDRRFRGARPARPRSACGRSRCVGEKRGRGLHRARARARGELRNPRRLSAEARVHGARYRGHAARRHRLARQVSVHARPLPDDVSRPRMDDAPDRGLRHGGRHEPALQVPDRARPDRPVDGLRHADADGLRQRSPDERGRSRPRGCGDRHARRHGAPVRRHRSYEDLRVDDDQSQRVDPACDVRRAGTEARLRPACAVGNDPGRHPQGIPGAEGMGVPGGAVGAHRPRLHHVLRAQHEALQPDQHLGLPHLGSRRVAARRGRVHDVQPRSRTSRRC